MLPVLFRNNLNSLLAHATTASFGGLRGSVKLGGKPAAAAITGALGQGRIARGCCSMPAMNRAKPVWPRALTSCSQRQQHGHEIEQAVWRLLPAAGPRPLRRHSGASGARPPASAAAVQRYGANQRPRLCAQRDLSLSGRSPLQGRQARNCRRRRRHRRAHGAPHFCRFFAALVPCSPFLLCSLCKETDSRVRAGSTMAAAVCSQRLQGQGGDGGLGPQPGSQPLLGDPSLFVLACTCLSSGTWPLHDSWKPVKHGLPDRYMS